MSDVNIFACVAKFSEAINETILACISLDDYFDMPLYSCVLTPASRHRWVSYVMRRAPYLKVWVLWIYMFEIWWRYISGDFFGDDISKGPH